MMQKMETHVYLVAAIKKKKKKKLPPEVFPISFLSFI